MRKPSAITHGRHVLPRAAAEAEQARLTFARLASFAHRAEGDAAQQLLAQQHGEDENRHEEHCRAGADRRPVLPALADDGRDEGRRGLRLAGGQSTAKAYSFQAKIRQKIAVAAMPVAACGSTTLQNACSRV